jgi:hypothetical protein
MVVLVVSLITVPSGSVLVVVSVLLLLLVELVVTGAGGGGGAAVGVEEEQPDTESPAARIAEVMSKVLSFIIKNLPPMNLASNTVIERSHS